MEANFVEVESLGFNLFRGAPSPCHGRASQICNEPNASLTGEAPDHG
jgi:hypothetical protein